MNLDKKIIACMNRAFRIDNASENTSTKNCDGWDSLNHLNLVIELENEFDIELEPEEIGSMNDFESVKKIIEEKI